MRTRDEAGSAVHSPSPATTYHLPLLARLRARCGEFWWWSALVFLSCRIGDVINVFTGLWLVPRYVGADELGAALPLLYIGSIFGLPIAVLIIPFSRWLTLYAAHGEVGKIKRMLRSVLGGVVATFLVSALTAKFLLPHFFERLRVAEGSLGVLIVCSGLIGPCATTFSNALQGLKRFGALSLVNVLSAPIRLVSMLVTMPFRALSGYMVGQISSPVVTIAVSAFTLRHDLGGNVKSEQIGREDLRAMVRYTVPIAVQVVLGTLLFTWQMLMFRQRLPQVESAAFYVVSRLAEVAAYTGLSLSVVAFPFAAEAGENGASESIRLLRKMLLGTILPGVALTLLFVFIAKPVMLLVPEWAKYASYSNMMPLYALRVTLTAAVSAFITFEMAAAHFRFLWYWVPLTLIENGVLIALTGYGAFRGILPDSLVDWMQSLNAASLSFFLWWLTASAFAMAIAVAAHICARVASNRSASGR